MRVPSLKKLKEIPDADHKEMRRIFKLSRLLLLQEKGAKELVSFLYYRRPKTFSLRLAALNVVARTHGVECSWFKGDRVCYYLNTGSMDCPTVIYWDSKYRVQAWSDFVGTMERRGLTQRY